MENFSVESVQPMSDTESPRSLAKAAIKRRKKTVESDLEAQKLVVAGPLANQHQEVVQPRLDPDRVLKLSVRLTDEELGK